MSVLRSVSGRQYFYQPDRSQTRASSRCGADQRCLNVICAVASLVLRSFRGAFGKREVEERAVANRWHRLLESRLRSEAVAIEREQRCQLAGSDVISLQTDDHLCSMAIVQKTH